MIASYYAFDTVLGRYSLIKHIDPACCVTMRLYNPLANYLYREAKLLVRLNNPGCPGIPQIYDYMPLHSALAMKYVEGQKLCATLRQRDEALPAIEALCHTRRICAVLAYMHELPGGAESAWRDQLQ